MENHTTEKQDSSASLSHAERKRIVAKRLKKARLNGGYTQRDVAAYLSISQASYFRMEAMVLEPSAIQLASLSTLYGVSVLWLLGYPNYIVIDRERL